MSGGAGPLTAVSLFAGIGGFDLACHAAGITVAAAVEIDPACRGVLARHFPRTTLFEDVTEVTGDQLRATGFVPGQGIICAGWPCQGNSAAGRRRGLADPRSGLWRHVVRLVAETRPRWFLGENVPGLLSVPRGTGRDFARVLTDLDDLGYGVAWRVLDAQWFGLAQQRRRVFLAGCAGDGAAWLPAQVLLEPDSSSGHPAPGGPAGPGAARPRGRGADRAGRRGRVVAATLQGGGRRGHRVDAEGAACGHLITHAITAREGKGADSDATTGFVLTRTAVRRLTPRECERLQGFPDDWTRHATDGREQSDFARYRQLGNAVAVPVAEWLARRLVAADATTRPLAEGRPAA